MKYKKFSMFLAVHYKTILVTTVFAGLLLIILIFDPAESQIFPPCPFHKITHLYCPGCGSLRACHQILHGNFLQAFRFNPLMIFFAIGIGFYLTAVCISPKTTRYFNNFSTKIRLPLTVLIIIVSYWFLRNLPMYPFTMLSPQ